MDEMLIQFDFHDAKSNCNVFFCIKIRPIKDQVKKSLRWHSLTNFSGISSECGLAELAEEPGKT